MIVYHGSNQEIRKPDCVHSRKKVDFGVGFYVTPLQEQANHWSEKFKRQGESAIVSQYELNDLAFEQYKVLKFEAYNGEWLDFVFACRQGNDPGGYDIIMGGVANDRVFDTINLYFDRLIGKDEALGRLKYLGPSYQICIKRQEVLDHFLTFIRSETL